MTFGAPGWLLLLPILGFAGWYWRFPDLWKPLRVWCVILTIFGLAEPRLGGVGNGMDVWVLVDRSASAKELIVPRLPEMETLLRRGAPSDDRLRFVDYAGYAAVRPDSGGLPEGGDEQATRTGLAVEVALANLASGRPARVLVLSDGYSTEPLTRVGERLVRQGVPLDYRLVNASGDRDYRVSALSVPARVQQAEPFLVELRVEGVPDGDVPFEFRRDGRTVAKGTAVVRQGVATLRFHDRLLQGGAYQYAVQLLPAKDAFAGNNRAQAWVEVVGGPRIVLITAYRDDPLAAVLRAQGFEVEVVDDPSRLHVGRLSGAKGVIVNNVPAYQLPPDFLAAIEMYVTIQGGGFLLAGGQKSFGAGGYFGSRVEELLPVSMELKKEHRKGSVAMAIILDRSGSMAVPVSAGVTKMDLANQGAARTIELLGDQDALTVFAVDSSAHEIVPLTNVGSHRAEMTDAVRRVASMGGGIFVYEGLKAGWEELKQAPYGQRHLILFADARDAEEPGDYESLVDEMVREKTTVSVIGMGTDADVDAQLLKDIAERGKGRVFFANDPAELPAVFAQETVAVARSTFVQEPVKVTPTAGWLEVASEGLKGLPSVDGYNFNYLKPEATVGLATADEEASPLVAFWQRGAGRVAAVSFPLGGPYSSRVREWTGYGDFLQTLSRWLMGETPPPGIGLRTRMEGGELRVDLLFDETWEERLAVTPPQLVLADGISRTITPVTWERLQPGHFQARMSLGEGRWYRGAVRLGKTVLPFGPVFAGTNVEWAFDRARLKELQEVSRVSGGEERADLQSIWKARPTGHLKDLRSWILVMLLISVVVEVAQSRLGWHFPKAFSLRAINLEGFTRWRISRPARSEAKPSFSETTIPQVPSLETPPSPSEQNVERRQRFRRAKRQG